MRTRPGCLSKTSIARATLAIVAATGAGGSRQAATATLTWADSAATANWSDSGNWLPSPGSVPSASDQVYIGNATPTGAAADAAVIIASGSVAGGNVYLGYAGATTGELTVQRDASLAAGALTLGTSGTGFLRVDGGNVSVSGAFSVGFRAGSAGGTGHLKITNGGTLNTTSTRYTQVGYQAGVLQSTVLIDGQGAAWTTSGGVIIGAANGGSGAVTVQNGGLLDLKSGDNFGLGLADAVGATGSLVVDGPGSSVFARPGLVVGIQGRASLSILNGATLESSADLWDYDRIGQSSTMDGTRAEGHVVVDGRGSSWINHTGLVVGYAGVGTLTISNGASVGSSYDSFIGYTRARSSGQDALHAGHGEVSIAGPGSIWTTRTLDMAANRGADAILTVADGGTLRTTGKAGSSYDVRIGNGGNGVVNVGAPAGQPAAAPGHIDVGTIQLVRRDDSRIGFNHTAVDTDNYFFAPSMFGDGTVDVLSGVTLLTGTNTYSGPTTISAGVLKAGADSAFSPNSDFVVNRSGTLDVNGIGQTVLGLSNNGLVNMGSGTAPGTVLTTTNYVGDGGTIVMNARLGTDASPADRLVIDGGAATGTSSLRIANAGGAGAKTVGNGIVVVAAVNGATTAPGAFALAGRVTAGPYEYTLFRASTDASAPESWYLRSTLDCSLQPSAPECQGPQPQPVYYRVETSVYAALPSLALLYGRNLLDTLHERVGEQAISGGRGLNATTPNTGAWGRAIGTDGKQDGDPRGIFGAGPQYGYDFVGLQVGHDLLRAAHRDGSRDHVGAYFAYGRADGTVTHFDGRTGTDKFDAYTFGGYWTHFGASGWYVDSVLQGTRYDSTSTANAGLPALKTHGNGIAASVEGGRPFRLAHGWFVEPQVQLIYQAIDLADAGDTKAQVTFSNVDSLAGRIGARLGRTWSLDGAAGGRQLTAWIRPNIWHEFRGDPVTRFSSADGLVPFRAALGGTWGEVNVGASGQAGRNTTLFANASYSERFDGAGHAYNGKVGLRIDW